MSKRTFGVAAALTFLITLLMAGSGAVAATSPSSSDASPFFDGSDWQEIAPAFQPELTSAAPADAQSPFDGDFGHGNAPHHHHSDYAGLAQVFSPGLMTSISQPAQGRRGKHCADYKPGPLLEPPSRT